MNNQDRRVCQTGPCPTMDLRFKGTLGDGNCLYHAIIRVLESSPIRRKYTVEKLRKIVAFRITNASRRYLRDKMTFFVETIDDHEWLKQSDAAQWDIDSFRSAWANAILGKEWGDESVLQILSDHFFITFFVFDDRCRLIGRTHNVTSNLISFLHLHGRNVRELHYSNIYQLTDDNTEQYIHDKQWACAQNFGQGFPAENNFR